METMLVTLMEGCLAMVDRAGGYPLMFLAAGLAGSLSHCVGMCGPFVMTQSSRFERVSQSAIIPYHLGRITTYVILGMIFYNVVNMMAFLSPTRVWMTAPILLMAGT